MNVRGEFTPAMHRLTRVGVGGLTKEEGWRGELAFECNKQIPFGNDKKGRLTSGAGVTRREGG